MHIMTLIDQDYNMRKSRDIVGLSLYIGFYTRDAMYSAVFATATCPSARLSVRLSVTAGIVSSRAKAVS